MNEKYIAFISYRHLEEDKKMAEWLQKYIEQFVLPKSVRLDKKQKHPGRVFRDTTELRTSHLLDEDLRNAIQHSKYLIVICSDETKESRWIDLEVEEFLKTHPADNVILVSIGEDPVKTIPEKVWLSMTGSLDRDPYICCMYGLNDASKKKEGQRIISQICSCRYSELVDRMKEYRRKQAAGLAAVAFSILCLFLAQAFVSLKRIQTEQEEKLESSAKLFLEQGQTIMDSENPIDGLPSLLQAYDILPEANPLKTKSVGMMSVAMDLYSSPERVMEGADFSSLTVSDSIVYDETVEKTISSSSGDYLCIVGENGLYTIYDLQSGDSRSIDVPESIFFRSMPYINDLQNDCFLLYDQRGFLVFDCKAGKELYSYPFDNENRIEQYNYNPGTNTLYFGKTVDSKKNVLKVLSLQIDSLELRDLGELLIDDKLSTDVLTSNFAFDNESDFFVLECSQENQYRGSDYYLLFFDLDDQQLVSSVEYDEYSSPYINGNYVYTISSGTGGNTTGAISYGGKIVCTAVETNDIQLIKTNITTGSKVWTHSFHIQGRHGEILFNQFLKELILSFQNQIFVFSEDGKMKESFILTSRAANICTDVQDFSFLALAEDGNLFFSDDTHRIYKITKMLQKTGKCSECIPNRNCLVIQDAQDGKKIRIYKPKEDNPYVERISLPPYGETDDLYFLEDSYSIQNYVLFGHISNSSHDWTDLVFLDENNQIIFLPLSEPVEMAYPIIIADGKKIEIYQRFCNSKVVITVDQEGQLILSEVKIFPEETFPYFSKSWIVRYTPKGWSGPCELTMTSYDGTREFSWIIEIPETFLANNTDSQGDIDKGKEFNILFPVDFTFDENSDYFLLNLSDHLDYVFIGDLNQKKLFPVSVGTDLTPEYPDSITNNSYFFPEQPILIVPAEEERRFWVFDGVKSETLFVQLDEQLKNLSFSADNKKIIALLNSGEIAVFPVENYRNSDSWIIENKTLVAPQKYLNSPRIRYIEELNCYDVVVSTYFGSPHFLFTHDFSSLRAVLMYYGLFLQHNGVFLLEDDNSIGNFRHAESIGLLRILDDEEVVALARQTVNGLN